MKEKKKCSFPKCEEAKYSTSSYCQKHKRIIDRASYHRKKHHYEKDKLIARHIRAELPSLSNLEIYKIIRIVRSGIGLGRKPID